MSVAAPPPKARVGSESLGQGETFRNGKYVCFCHFSVNCCHLLAQLLAMGMDIANKRIPFGCSKRHTIHIENVAVAKQRCHPFIVISITGWLVMLRDERQWNMDGMKMSIPGEKLREHVVHQIVLSCTCSWKLVRCVVLTYQTADTAK